MQDGIAGYDSAKKSEFSWISLIRLPDFITKKDFDWAISLATKKKKTDFSKVEFFNYIEGVCVQALHLGAFDDEPITTKAMHEFAESQGYKLDISEKRYHHEIYLSDPRKTEPLKFKTIVRHPIIKI